jgi:CBS domain-containing protein
MCRLRFAGHASATYRETASTQTSSGGGRGGHPSSSLASGIHHSMQEEEKKGGKKGRLLGIITLSDVLRYVIGPGDIGETPEPKEDAEEELKAAPS